MTAAIVMIKVLILILLSVGMYFLLKAIREYELLQKVRSKMDELDRQRLLSENPEGILQKYLNRLDEQLVQAEVKKYLPRAGVEIYFLFNVLEFTLIFCLAGDGILVPLLIAGLAVYLNKMILDILRFRNKRITEKHLLDIFSTCFIGRERSCRKSSSGRDCMSPWKIPLERAEVRSIRSCKGGLSPLEPSMR